MCGRFSFSPTAKIIEDRFQISIEEAFYQPKYNCAPSQNLAVISNASPGKLSFYRWGLIPFWAKEMSIGNRMINAKSESIAEKPSFKNPFKRKRCLVLGDGFFEWKNEVKKIPYRITLVDNSLFAMAGIWDEWKTPDGMVIQSFAIITTGANELMIGIHHRMPVILKPEDEKAWLQENDTGILQSLLKPYPSDEMIAYEVSSLVNNPRNDSPEILLAAG